MKRTISSLSEFINLIVEFDNKNAYYRGESKKNLSLLPSAFRGDEISTAVSNIDEKEIINNFRDELSHLTEDVVN